MFTKAIWDKSFIFNSIRLRREWLGFKQGKPCVCPRCWMLSSRGFFAHRERMLRSMHACIWWIKRRQGVAPCMGTCVSWSPPRGCAGTFNPRLPEGNTLCTVASRTGLLSPCDSFRLASLTLLNTNGLKKKRMLGRTHPSHCRCVSSPKRDPGWSRGNWHSTCSVSLDPTLFLSGCQGMRYPGLECGPESCTLPWPGF
jgi:hypothetical protein